MFLTEGVGSRVSNTITKMVLVLSVLLVSSGAAFGLDAVLSTRPLTTQEVTDYALPATTAFAPGIPVTGLGSPVYLDALTDAEYEPAEDVFVPVVVTQVVWSLDSAPVGSAATLQPSILGPAVPSYDGGDQQSYQIAGRRMLAPDVAGQYELTVDIYTLSNGMASASLTVTGAKYLGLNFEEDDASTDIVLEDLCRTCHFNKIDDYKETGHADFFKRGITGTVSSHYGEGCISCHTTGYDPNPAAVNSGFDDVAAAEGWVFPGNFNANKWNLVPEPLKAKANIKCESCHGPAREHMEAWAETERIGISLSAGNCGQCHDALTHHWYNFEWEQSGHAQGEVFRGSGSCSPCHSAVGFIETHDPDYAADDKTPRATGNEGITCAACHDPHANDGPHQTRPFTQVELGSGDVITDGGLGLLCMQCHKGRRDAEAYAFTGSGDHFGPHHGPQGDMLAGKNAIEYGMTMPTSRHLWQVEDSCVGCHMQRVEDTEFDAAFMSAGGHTWKMNWDNGTTNTADDVAITLSCKECHGDIDTFDFGGEDYDHDGVVEGVQTEIEGLLHHLALLLPPVGSEEVTHGVGRNDPIEIKRAFFNYLFVEEDGSHGVHNPKYAAAILQASIGDLSGGIDVDCDGLIDAWEIEHFGNITSQDGSGDPDLDGLTNAQEQGVGTDPTEADSDNDTFDDLVELEGHSNPMDIGDVPGTNTLQILTAIEVGYLGEVGVTNRLQSTSTLIGAPAWTDVGTNFVGTGAWNFQTFSAREMAKRFFRVVQP